MKRDKIVNTVLKNSRWIVYRMWERQFSEKNLKTLVEKIRNKIAHAHMIESGTSWREVIDVTIRVDSLIVKLE